MDITRLDPWFIMGDLNEITGNHEKQGGSLRQASTFVAFNQMVLNCGFLEFPCLGIHYRGGDGEILKLFDAGWIGIWLMKIGTPFLHTLLWNILV